jgi:cell division protease FtsH
MKNSNKQPTSLISYLLPYLMMGLAVLTFVWLVFFSNPLGTTTISTTNLAQFLMTENVQTVTTTERETVTSISGTYLNEAGETIYFTATFETSNTFIKSAVDEALSTRLDSDGGFYYDGKWVTNNAFESNWFDAWGPTILVVGGSAVIFLFLFSRMNASVNSSNNKALEFNKSRARREDNSKTKFNDVAGADEEKAELVEVVEYLRNPGKYTKLGAKLPKGILLVGPPGTGKTLLAKAVAGEAGVPFYSISGSDFVEMFVGVGAGRVRDMFKRAKQTAPCLIFIDEIDAVGRQRGAGMGGGNDEREQTLNQLLVELDGFADNSGIIVIAATNRDDVLDPALLRAGRFDRQITVNLPDRRGRAAIFAVHSRNKKIDPEIDFEAISRRTVGFSGADIANIMNEAAILAVRNSRDVVTLKDIDEAIDRRIAGPAKSSKGMSEHEREVVAFHEAGHAVIGLNLPFSDKVQKITIVPRGRTGGHVLMTPEEDRFLMTKNQLEARIIGYLGGRTSEEIFFGDVSTGAQNDIEVATRIARMMVTEYGMSPLGPIQYESNSGSVFLGRDYNSTQKNFSTQVAFEIDKEVRGIIDRAHEQARLILTKNKDQVTLIAKTLLEKETITSEEIAKLILQPTVEAKKEEETPKPRARKKKVTSDA